MKHGQTKPNLEDVHFLMLWVHYEIQHYLITFILQGSFPEKKTSLRFSSSCPLIVHAVDRVAHLHADGVHMIWHPMLLTFDTFFRLKQCGSHSRLMRLGFFLAQAGQDFHSQISCSKELEVPSNFIHRNFIEMCNSWDGHLIFCPRSKHWAQFLESKRRPSWRFCDLFDLKRKMKNWFQDVSSSMQDCGQLRCWAWNPLNDLNRQKDGDFQQETLERILCLFQLSTAIEKYMAQSLLVRIDPILSFWVLLVFVRWHWGNI